MTDPLSFFLDRYKAEIPQRTHSRDTADDGAPAWHRSFEVWLTDGDGGRWSTSKASDLVDCPHPRQGCPPGCRQVHVHEPNEHREFCPRDCMALHCWDCEGGLRQRINERWRHPVKRALDQLSRIPVPKGRPKLDLTLIVLAENDGNVGLTIAALAAGYSFMWQPVKGRRWIMHALWRFRAAYREDAPARMLRKSESQEIAEVAA